MRSAPDHLLEEYNKKYSLGIPLTSELYPRTFERKAETLGNKNALIFLDWYKKEMTTLKNDPTCAFLMRQRVISIHRQAIKPVARRTITYSIDAVIGEATPNQSESLKERPSQRQTLGWFFTNNDRQDILTMCSHYYKEMETFVGKAKGNFP